MDIQVAIYSRRSIRSYTDAPVEKAVIDEILAAAVQAPTGMNLQPWAFGVIQGVDVVQSYSDRAKKVLLEMFGDAEWFAGHKDVVAAPEFSLFYGAPALVVVYAKPAGPGAPADCCLAAENFMLAAFAKGLGTCWIGFATGFFESAETKKELGVPDDYCAVAPIILGYPGGTPKPVEKKPPEILFWK